MTIVISDKFDLNQTINYKHQEQVIIIRILFNFFLNFYRYLHDEDFYVNFFIWLK